MVSVKGLVKERQEGNNGSVRIPLIERLSPGAPELAGFDAMVTRVDCRSSARSEFAYNTTKAYSRRYRRYREWCEEVGYQPGPEFITSDKITEFVQYCATVKRYAPKTIWQSIRALELYAERAGNAVSTLEARGVLDLYRDVLAQAGFGERRRREQRAA